MTLLNLSNLPIYQQSLISLHEFPFFHMSNVFKSRLDFRQFSLMIVGEIFVDVQSSNWFIFLDSILLSDHPTPLVFYFLCSDTKDAVDDAPLDVLSYMAKKKKANPPNRETIFAINRPYRYRSFGLQTKRRFFVSILELNQVLTSFLISSYRSGFQNMIFRYFSVSPMVIFTITVR